MRRMRISWRMILMSNPVPLASAKTSLMSAASVRFSSSSRSMRSMNERSRSPAIPPTSGIAPPSPYVKKSVLRLGGGEGGLLLGRRLLLVLLAPLVVRHAVDDLARLRVGQRDALLLGGGAVPFRQAV